MQNGKDNFEKKLEFLQKKMEDKDNIRNKYEELLTRLLPQAFDTIVEIFKHVCISPFQVEEAEIEVSKLFFNKDNSNFINKFEFKKIKINLYDRNVQIRLNPGIGYLGALARIDIIKHKIRKNDIYIGNHQIIDDGIYCDIDLKSDKLKIFWLSKKGVSIPFNENTVKEVLEQLFLSDINI